MLIRQATENDLNDIHGMLKEFKTVRPISINKLIEQTHLLVNRGEVIGMIIHKENIVQEFKVHPKVRKKGAGTALLALIEAMISEKYKNVAVEVAKKDQQTSDFLRKRGYILSENIEPESRPTLKLYKNVA